MLVWASGGFLDCNTIVWYANQLTPLICSVAIIIIFIILHNCIHGDYDGILIAESCMVAEDRSHLTVS